MHTYAHIHPYMGTLTQVCTHICKCTHRHRYPQSYYAYINTYKLTFIQINMCTQKHTYKPTQTRNHTGTTLKSSTNSLVVSHI